MFIDRFARVNWRDGASNRQEAEANAFAAELLMPRRLIEREVSEALEKKVDFIVTTEKDAVRLPDGLPCPVPVYYLRLEIDIIRGAADFDEAVGRICFPETALPEHVGRGVSAQDVVSDRG